jgi:hypothetical protein
MFGSREMKWRYSSPSIIKMTKSRRMRWAGHVARIGRVGMLIRTEESTSRKEPCLYAKLLVQTQYWRHSSISRSRDSSVCIATGYWLDGRCSDSGREKFFTSPCCPNCLWGPPNLMFNGYLGLFFWGLKRQRGEADHSHLGPRSRMVELYLHSAICFHGIQLN